MVTMIMITEVMAVEKKKIISVGEQDIFIIGHTRVMKVDMFKNVTIVNKQMPKQVIM